MRTALVAGAASVVVALAVQMFRRRRRRLSGLPSTIDEAERAHEQCAAEDELDSCMFYVVSAAHLLQCEDAMPSFHELLRHDPECSGRVLRRVQVQRTTALRGGYVDNICTMAHVWRTQHDPDPDGEQMRALKCFLRSHPQVRWIWMDYSCMPQGQAHRRIRTRAEYVEFQWMLLNMNWLFLATRTINLIDLTYLSRFW